MHKSAAHFQETLRRQLPTLTARHHISSLGLFGSRVRGDERSDSDLDVLVSFDRTPSLLQFISLEQELSDLLGVKVDLVMRESLKSHVGERVLAEVVPV
jgi:predicted nucleotidyltransferase